MTWWIFWALLHAALISTSIAQPNPLNNAKDLWNAAVDAWQKQNSEESLQCLNELKKIRPNYPSINLAYGAIYHRNGEWELAILHYERMKLLEPHNLDVHMNLAQLFFDMKKYKEAITTFQDALNIESSPKEKIYHSLGLLYHMIGDELQAEYWYRHGNTQTPQYHFDFGVTLQRNGKIIEANSEYNKAILLRQDFAQAWLNIAALHQQYGDVNQSIPHYHRVLQLPSSSPSLKMMAMTNLGVAYELTNDVPSALLWFDKALSYMSEVEYESLLEKELAHILLLVHKGRSSKSACIWNNYDQYLDELLYHVEEFELSRGISSSFLPFDTLLYPTPWKMRRSIAELYAKQFEFHPHKYLFDKEFLHLRENRARLHIGYLSYDYADHPTAHLMEGLFVHHNKATYEISAFGYGRNDGSACRKSIEKEAERFVNMAELSIDESADLIFQNKVHILVDAQGHTRGSRTHIIGKKPAPIIVNYLVYPGTLGARYIDYLITDRWVTPPEISRHFTEKLAVLPDSYQVNYYAESVRAQILHNEKYQPDSKIVEASEQGFLFINFNKIDKLDPTVFSVWMSILRRVPGSCLLLLDPSKSHEKSATSGEIKKNILSAAAAHGIQHHRILFVPRVPKVEHLGRHRVDGLFIDTFTYGAHSTATDSLFAGLPVLTLAGNAFASRVGISLLSNMEMNEMVTFSVKEYEDQAVMLATSQRQILHRMREDLVEDGPNRGLFRTDRYTKSLEHAYQIMYEIYVRVAEPRHILV